MADLTVRALEPATWPAFADLVERNGGVWGGCWCLGFHPEGKNGRPPEERRTAKLGRVEAGTAHAALVFEGDVCLGWCQYGPPTELTRIKHRRAYEAEAPSAPDWRITCFYADRAARGRGVADVALGGALDLIARAGGGVVESSPESVAGRRTSGSFLYNATLELFEQHGFTRVRQLGKHHWLVTRTVVPA